MTDHRQPAADGNDEILSAYLAGELDAAASADLEQRLGRDPALAARLDALADALVALGGFDDVEPPEGYEARLDQHLRAQRQVSVSDLGEHRAARRNRSGLWLRVGAAAAVLVGGMVMAGNVLQGVDGAGTTADSAESAQVEQGFDPEGGEAAGADDSAPLAPVVLDRNVTIADQAALRRRYTDLPEVQAVLGLKVSESGRLAKRFTRLVAQRDEATASRALTATGGSGGATSGGSVASGQADKGATFDRESSEAAEQPEAAQAPAPAPNADADAATAGGDPCLEMIVESADAPLVPVRVETLRYDGRRALAYVFVTASPDATRLDRTEVWIVARRGCETLTFQQY